MEKSSFAWYWILAINTAFRFNLVRRGTINSRPRCSETRGIHARRIWMKAEKSSAMLIIGVIYRRHSCPNSLRHLPFVGCLVGNHLAFTHFTHSAGLNLLHEFDMLNERRGTPAVKSIMFEERLQCINWQSAWQSMVDQCYGYLLYVGEMIHEPPYYTGDLFIMILFWSSAAPFRSDRPSWFPVWWSSSF